MVKSSVTGEFNRIATSHLKDIFKRFGRDDIIWYTHTDTINEDGSLILPTSTSETIVGDLQPLTADDKELIDIGEAQIGDAKLYTYSSYNIQQHDRILVDIVLYEIVRLLEKPVLNKATHMSVWFCKRLD